MTRAIEQYDLTGGLAISGSNADPETEASPRKAETQAPQMYSGPRVTEAGEVCD